MTRVDVVDPLQGVFVVEGSSVLLVALSRQEETVNEAFLAYDGVDFKVALKISLDTSIKI